MLGNYLSAATLWRDRAIPRVRADRSSRVIGAGTALAHGEALQATNTFLTLPSTLHQQASWEYDLAMVDLEAGIPDEAAEHFTKALTLAPDLVVRPIAAYYLQKMGKPVPPPGKSDGATTNKADPSKVPLDQSLVPKGTILVVPPAGPTGALTPATPRPPAAKEVTRPDAPAAPPR